MPETTDIFEVMSTMRAMRRLKPDPVPDELISKILQAGQLGAERRQHSALAVPGGQGPGDQEEGAGLLQAPVRRDGRAALRVERAAARRPTRPLPAPARRGRIPDRPLPRGAGVDRRLPRGRRRTRAARPARRSIRRCRTCCWRRARSVSARR